MKEEGYRLNVGIIVANNEGEVLLCKRRGINSWQFPQGGIDKNEDPRKAAKRELFEEVGISSKYVKLIKSSDDWYKYDVPKKSRRKILVNKGFKGQKQKWFLMRYLGNDDDINIKTDKPEFLEWKWIDLDMITEVVVDFKLHVYKELKEKVKKIIS